MRARAAGERRKGHGEGEEGNWKCRRRRCPAAAKVNDTRSGTKARRKYRRKSRCSALAECVFGGVHKNDGAQKGRRGARAPRSRSDNRKDIPKAKRETNMNTEAAPTAATKKGGRQQQEKKPFLGPFSNPRHSTVSAFLFLSPFVPIERRRRRRCCRRRRR